VSGRTGRTEASRVIYDNYGSQIYRVDYSDHMRSLNHSLPHLHQFEFGIGYSFGKETVFNLKKNMTYINKLEDILKEYSYWKPNDIAYIKEIHWNQDGLKVICYFQSRNNREMWPDLNQSFIELILHFENVKNVKLNFSGSGLYFVSGFDIINVSEDGLEKINFYIHDYEDESIEFSCEKIEVLSVGQPFLLDL